MGIVATVGGAMMMTLLKGPMLPWTKGGVNQDSSCASDNHNFFKGAFMILIGCICWSAFINVQSNMLTAWFLRPRLIMKEKGPVFVSAFSPLSIFIVAIIGSIVLAETIYVGMVDGAIVIVVGLYLVLWGKSSDQHAPTAQDDQQP